MTTHALQWNTVRIEKVTLERRLFMALIVLLVLLFMSYMFCVGKVVFAVVERKAAEQNVRELSASISDLESQYIRLSQSIDTSRAQALGFTEPASVGFADVNGAKLTLNIPSHAF